MNAEFLHTGFLAFSALPISVLGVAKDTFSSSIFALGVAV